jgi:hypothetical protein
LSKPRISLFDLGERGRRRRFGRLLGAMAMGVLISQSAGYLSRVGSTLPVVGQPQYSDRYGLEVWASAPVVLIADTTGTTSGTMTYTAGHANHGRTADLTYRNLRTTGYEWHVSTQRTAPLTFRTSSWTWTASGANANAFYVRFGASTNPLIPNDSNRRVLENGTPLTLGASVAALTAGQWFYGDADTLGYSTIYVRLSDDADPDSKATDYVQVDSLLHYLTATGGTDPVIGSPTEPAYYWGGLVMVSGTITALKERQYAIGDQDSLGFNTLYFHQPQQYSAGIGGPGWLADVDSHPDGAVMQSYQNPSFSWGSGRASTAHMVRWRFKLSGATVKEIHGLTAGCDLEHDSVELYVENDTGLTDTETRTCSMTAFSGTTVYIATAGNDTTGDGSIGTPYATLSKATTILGLSNSNRRILCNGGDTFSGAGFTITGDNWIIDSYGTGTPTLDLTSSITQNGSNLAIRNVRIGKSTSSAVTTINSGANTRINGLTLANISLFGYVASFVGNDRVATGVLLRNVTCEDMSTAGGMTAYLIYSVCRVATPIIGHPCRMMTIDSCANDYGNQNEVIIRVGGDYVTIYNSEFEQTNLTSTLRNKAAGPRCVGGFNWWVSQSEFRIAEDTTGKSMNGGQGTNALSFAPADGQSWAARDHVYERNLCIGCGFATATLTKDNTTFTDYITVRANIFDLSQYPKHSYMFVMFDGQHAATCSTWRVIHNTFLADQDGTVAVRPLDFGEAPGLLATGFVIENNLYQNPSLAVVNNDTNVPIFLAARTSNTGTTQFASVAHNVSTAPDTSEAAGNYAGTGASTFMVRWRNSSGSNTHYWGFDDLNGTDWADDNTFETVTLDASYRITGSPTAKTQGVRSTGCRYDYYGNTIAATGGAIGAVENAAAATSVNTGGGSFPVWI